MPDGAPDFLLSEEPRMIDYYAILGVKRTATAAEIKSAYRRLARKRHPDLNGGSEQAAREFALIALAYRTLSNPHERARYDAQWNRIMRSGSVFDSNNPHAQRMRRAAAQARWDRAVERWLEAERREAFMRAQAVFTTVTLFLSTFFVAMLKPRLWESLDLFGRAILLTLFVIGVWHLAARLRTCFAYYTYRPMPIQTSLMQVEPERRPFSRAVASAFLIVGYIVSLAAGLIVGEHTYYIVSDMAFFFDQRLRPDLIFYPPIAVLIVDTMHAVASKIDA
ncbi:J domain-containing protein [Pyrinomonas sp.]|uniref:J domain-containing protein n=1 Tax=Pyrinomonas sp. TaxID=2080306 RepID=UPI003327478E